MLKSLESESEPVSLYAIKRYSSVKFDVGITRREFDVWLEAFKQGDLFEEIVEGFDHDWSLIYKELHRIFKRNVWNHVLEQRARERDHDRIIPSTQTFHGRMPVKSTENVAKSTEDRFLQRPAERRTDHISLF